MKVTIHGHHLDIGDALRTHISDKMSALNEKYFNHAVNATVTMSKDPRSLYKSHISMTIGHDIHVQATASEHEVYATFDQAAEKVAKQLRRYKRKIREHNEQKESAARQQAQEYTLGFSVADEQLDQLTDAELDDHSEAIVVAEMTTNIQTLTVSDAVMRLTLSGNNAIMFRNASHGEINMVYRRQDGNIGWVDPKDVLATKNKVA